MAMASLASSSAGKSSPRSGGIGWFGKRSSSNRMLRIAWRCGELFPSICSDAYLSRSGIQRGWATVIWRGRHVVEPTELTSEEESAFFAEVLRVLQAMQAHYEPLTTNLQRPAKMRGPLRG